MAGQLSQPFPKTATVLSACAALTLIVATAPSLAQQHHSGSTSHSKQTPTHQVSQNQMMMMLDQVETGKTTAQPTAHHAGQQMGFGQGTPAAASSMPRGIRRAPSLGAMGAMGAIGGGAAGLGMLHGGMTGGGGQMQFMQKLKQKLSSMQQGGVGGRGAGGQGQFLQQMMQGKSAPGAMGRAPMGQQAMPMMSQSGMGMGTQSKAPQQHFTPGSLLKSASATTGGSSLSMPAAAAPAASTKSDLERQMEQEYGR